MQVAKMRKLHPETIVKREGGLVMRVENDNATPPTTSITSVHLHNLGQTPSRPKFPISMEKKIEHLWLESESRGWRYSEFVVVVMEVLTVLHHRNKLRGSGRGVTRSARKNRA
jgi:hypothetical protein